VGLRKDVGKSAGIGVARGTISLAGAIGDLSDLGAKGLKVASEYIDDKLGIEPYHRPEKGVSPTLDAIGAVVNKIPGNADITKAVEDRTGEFYKPQTTAGHYAETVGEFVPAALTGPQSLVRKAILQAAVPGVASEAAGQYFKDTPYEGAARFVGGVAGGVGGAMINGPSTAARALSGKIPDYVTDAHFTQAQRLIDDAAARGVHLTGPEALSQVAGRNVLLDSQRMAESAPQSRDMMEAQLGDRPAAFNRAARTEIDRTLGPGTTEPSMIGPEAGRAAESTLNDVRGAINQATRPAYDAAGQTLVPRQVHAAMINDPLFQQALDNVRNDPARNSFVRTHSDRSIAVYDAVQKELEEQSQRASNPIQPGHSQAVSSATGTLAGDVRRMAIAADRAANGGPNAPSAYADAIQRQAELRRQYLEPLQQGPLGRIAHLPETTAAMEALFPRNPNPGSAEEVSRAVTALNQRSPWAAQQLVRAHVEKTLNESTRNLQGGASDYGASNFAKDLIGNVEQHASLQAAVEALPNGQARWDGMQRLLDVAQATGKRQRKGSLTAFNDPEMKGMAGGGPVSGAVKLGASPGKWWNVVNDKWSQWQLGNNLRDIAGIVTNPRSAELLGQLARTPTGSREAQILAARLTAQQISSSGDQSRKTEGQ
jgi:hypothetical protein